MTRVTYATQPRCGFVSGVGDNRPVPVDYRLAPQLAARLLGVALVGLGALVLVVTALVIAFTLPPWLVTGTMALVVVAVFVLGALITRKAYVVRLTDDGYVVRFVRGAGTKQGRWVDVEDAVTTYVAGAPCLVLRHRSGASTTIPVEILGGDREEFVRAVKGHLDRANRR